MTTPKFLQIHTLHSYPAALLNRDDSGLAKRLPFGGSIRTRISSQCLKRHWRVAQDEFSLHSIDGSTSALRSRNIVERKVMAPLKEKDAFSEEVLKSVEDAFNIGVYGRSGTSETGRQPLLLGLPEVEHLHQRAAAICTEHSGDAKAAGEAATALFNARRGRGQQLPCPPRYGPAPRRSGGCAVRTHGHFGPGGQHRRRHSRRPRLHRASGRKARATTSRWWTTCSATTKTPAPPTSADMELTAGLFYGYVVVDVPGLVSNLEGCKAEDWQSNDRELAAQGGGARAASDCHRDPRRQAGFHRSLCLRRPRFW